MELFFEDLYHKMECRIYVREQQGSRTVIIGYDGKNLVEQTLPDSPTADDFLPLLVIPISMKPILIAAFISEGDKMNMKTEGESAIRGKLDATEVHLNDMREISKKLIDSVLNRG